MLGVCLLFKRPFNSFMNDWQRKRRERESLPYFILNGHWMCLNEHIVLVCVCMFYCGLRSELLFILIKLNPEAILRGKILWCWCVFGRENRNEKCMSISSVFFSSVGKAGRKERRNKKKVAMMVFGEEKAKPLTHLSHHMIVRYTFLCVSLILLCMYDVSRLYWKRSKKMRYFKTNTNTNTQVKIDLIYLWAWKNQFIPLDLILTSFSAFLWIGADKLS